MKKYFMNPWKMEVTKLEETIGELHQKVIPYFNEGYARMNDDIIGNYKELIADEKLEYDSQKIDDIYIKLAKYSQGLIKWNDPGAMLNINPPATIASVAATSYFSLFNPNGAQDMSSGHLLACELAVVKMICQLVGWNENISGGIFTFGGKSTNMHAIKQGIQRIDSQIAKNGIDEKILCFSSMQGHICHKEVCSWLGIGENNCIRIETDELGVIDLIKLEKSMCDYIEKGYQIATIIVSGCTTLQMTIDPIKEIVELRDRVVKKYNMNYKPRVHVDSVIGWVWLFYKYYNFNINKLGLSEIVLEKLSRLCHKISEIKYADSFGVDFHKTGFCSYLSSLYMVKDRDELYLQGNRTPIKYSELEYGNYSPFEYTLELSRPLSGPIAAYVNLKLFGIEGYQKIMGNLMESTQYIKDIFKNEERFEVVNEKDSDGFVILFIVKELGSTFSFETLGREEERIVIQFGEYIHKFYMYLFEKQKKNECWFSLDYSSGYRTLASGKKIGVLKVYPMSPYFDIMQARRFVDDIKKMLVEFDKVKENFEVKEVPHKPRPFVYR